MARPASQIGAPQGKDGLEISKVTFSNIDLGDRYDAEYFTKEYLDIEQQLKRVTTKKLGTLATAVVSAFYPAATQIYSIGDTAFVRCVDCIEFPIITNDQDAQFEKIPYSFGKENKGISFLNKGEIVVTKVGTPCYASIVDDYEEVALSRTVMGLANIHGIDAYYLMIFCVVNTVLSNYTVNVSSPFNTNLRCHGLKL